jgi:hypothetical protein
MVPANLGKAFMQKLAKHTRLASALIVALVVAAPLKAQDNQDDGLWSKYNFGIQVAQLIPTGNALKNVAGNGLGIAGYAEKVWSNSWALRGRLEYTAFGEKEFGYGAKAKVSQVGVMLDGIYYMGLKDIIYPYVGIGYFRRTADLTTPGLKVSAPADTEMAVTVGVGWNLTKHLGAELKYSVCESSWLQASLLYRF